MDHLVAFENVHKAYDGKNFVVKDFNLQIKKGEFISMLGPSGSGKTTCLMMLAGFEQVSQGYIKIGKEDINNIAPYKRNIGVVFQNYALFPHMSVGENLAYPLKVRKLGKDEIEKKVQKYLELVELAEFKNRFPGQLSGGQKQRVALARALIFSPDIVLMDEPLGALDKNLREQMQYEIMRLHKKLGLTIVYVTHDQREALTMSDRIVVFNEGKAQQTGTPSEIYDFPSNVFVADFIGENNEFECTLETDSTNAYQVKLKNNQLISFDKIREIEFAQNKEMLLSIRPENIHLKKATDTQDSTNKVEATIVEYIYLGETIRIHCKMQGYDKLIVIKASRKEGSDFSIDEKVLLYFDKEKCLLL